jgi:hypothetical protein
MVVLLQLSLSNECYSRCEKRDDGSDGGCTCAQAIDIVDHEGDWGVGARLVGEGCVREGCGALRPRRGQARGSGLC